VNTGIEVEMSCSSSAKPFYRDIAATIKKDIAFIY